MVGAVLNPGSWGIHDKSNNDDPDDDKSTTTPTAAVTPLVVDQTLTPHDRQRMRAQRLLAVESRLRKHQTPTSNSSNNSKKRKEQVTAAQSKRSLPDALDFVSMKRRDCMFFKERYVSKGSIYSRKRV